MRRSAALQGGVDGNTARTEILSDGVFAIAMTVLVLDLRVPHHEAGHLLHGLLAQWPGYLSFLTSFLYIAVIWTNHHATFRHIHSIDRALQWANIGILLGAVILPFPTAVLAAAFHSGNHGDEQTALALYAASAILMSSAWLVFFLVLHRHAEDIRPLQDLATWKGQTRRPILGSTGYALGWAAGAVAVPAVGLATFALIPLYYALTSEGLRPAHRLVNHGCPQDR